MIFFRKREKIINGVVAAQAYGYTQIAKISLISAKFHSSTEGHLYCYETSVPLQKVVFDVAVTVTEERTSTSDGESIGSISVSSANLNSS